MTEIKGKSYNRRAFVSVLAGFSFILMALTGLVLFIAPSCREARDTSWTVWGQSKEQWVAVHVWFSTAFMIASIFHLYLNWTPMVNYFKSRVRKSFAFRIEWILALVICGVIYAGTIGGAAPFSSLIAWKETCKHSHSIAGTHGRGWRGARIDAQQDRNHLGAGGSNRSDRTDILECEGIGNNTGNKSLEHIDATEEGHCENC